ncbi:MAG: helix-turn-helix domain-containing protein [Planctomycetota bacterium]
MPHKLLATRLAIATHDCTIREIADRIEMNAETVRRYMSGRSPSYQFLAAICRHYEVLGTWLLLGEGPRTKEELIEQALHQVKANEMLQMIARRLDSIEDRLGELESVNRGLRPRTTSRADTSRAT